MKRMLLFLLLAVNIAYAANYYTDSSAPTALGLGTQADPFKTLASLTAAATTAGDNGNMQGYFRETLATAASGSAGSPITFRSYGSGATIDGSDFVTSGWFPLHTVPDSSGLGRVCTNYGAVLAVAGAVDTTGYSFDGVDDYIDTGSACIDSSDITVSAWVYARSTGGNGSGYGRILGNDLFSVYVASSTRFGISSNGRVTEISTAANSLELGKWINIIAVRHGAGYKVNVSDKDSLYVNGVLSGTPANSGTPAVTTNNVLIGNLAPLTRGFDGLIRNVIILNYCATLEQADSLYDGTLADLVQSSGATIAYKLGALRGVGSEKVTNGDFSGGDTGWSVGTGWSTAGNIATATNPTGNLTQTFLLVGQSYKTSIDWTKTSSSFNWYTGLNRIAIVEGPSGTSNNYVVAMNSNVVFINGGTFAGTVDNVSVQETALSLFLPLDTQPTARGSLFYASRDAVGNDSTYAMWGHADSLMTRKMSPTLLTAPNQWSNLMNGGYEYPSPRSLTAAGNKNDYRVVYAPADTAGAMKGNRYGVTISNKTYINLSGLSLKKNTGSSGSVGNHRGIYIAGTTATMNNISSCYFDSMACGVGTYSSTGGTTTGIYNNVFKNISSRSIDVVTTNCSIINNTFIGGAVHQNIQSTATVSNVTSKNNLHVGDLGTGKFVSTGASAVLTFSNNLYYRPNGYTALWYNTTGTYNSLADWKTAISGDANSVNADPLLTADYRLIAGSPAINKGDNTALPATTLDFYGHRKYGIRDIGAVEYIPLFSSMGEISNAIRHDIRNNFKSW